MRAYFFGTVAIVTLIFSLIFWQQIAAAIAMIGYAAAASVALVGLGGLFFGGWYLRERIGMLRAQRRQADRESHVLTVTENGETWVRDTDQKATWRNLTGTPALYVNGKPAMPQEWEIELHRLRLLTQASRPAQIIPGQAQLLPPPPVDLLTALDPIQRGLIVGASDSGKTTLLKWVIARRLQSSKVVVIDPHAYPGKWQGSYVIGTGRNYADIDRALTALVQIMTKRYGEIGRGEVGEGQHPRLTVIIDEWRAIVFNVKGADTAIKTLLTESRKVCFRAFLATHSERVRALGIEGEGDLKDGFAVVRLAMVNGVRTATIDTGSGEQPASLPGPYHAPSGRPGDTPILAEPNPDSDFTLELEPTEQERQILELHAAGQSHARISEAIWGYKSSNKYPEIDRVLAKFGVVQGAN